MSVKYEFFKGSLISWDSLLSQAAEFASKIGKDRLIGISQACDRSQGTVAVWYWA